MRSQSKSPPRIALGLITVFLLVFLSLQFIRPEVGNPPVTADLQAPPQVKEILRNSCYNCHSNETNLAWFDQIAPAYWLVARDVRQARMHLNFSELAAQPAAKQKAGLFEAVNQVQLGAMPLPSYLRVHPGAAVTHDQLAILRRYLLPPPQTATDPAPANAQYVKWISSRPKVTEPPTEPPVALNGVRFQVGYENWKLVNSTDRFDNQTMRVILGNEIAMKAIAGNQINPWPDGTAFAKVTWYQEPDGKGFVRTGAFEQVEFMIRDSKKYGATKNWGFARFRGVDLKPYGASPAFADECVGCHNPVRNSDYVYTIPVAALAGDLPFNPLHWNVITTFVNRTDSTMSTLFGNDAAVHYARTHSQHEYPAGSALALVTWAQREDPRWFGGNIPATVKSVEFAKPGPAPSEREADLLSQRGAVMPEPGYSW